MIHALMVMIMVLLAVPRAHAGEMPVAPPPEAFVLSKPPLPLADMPPPLSDTAAAPSFLRLNTVAQPVRTRKKVPTDLLRDIAPAPALPTLAPTMGLSWGSGVEMSGQRPENKGVSAAEKPLSPSVQRGPNH